MYTLMCLICTRYTGERWTGGRSGMKNRSRGRWIRHAFLHGSTDSKILNSNQLGSTVGKPYNGIQGIWSVPNCIMGTYKRIKSLKEAEGKLENIMWVRKATDRISHKIFPQQSCQQACSVTRSSVSGFTGHPLSARTWLDHCTKPPQTKHKQMGGLDSKTLSTKPGSRLDLLHGLSFIKSWSTW